MANHHARRLARDLEALGFQRDYEAKTKGMAYRHPNQPDEVIKVFDAMTDNTITAALRMANKIADTGWSGPRMPQTIKERAAITRRKQKTQRQREDQARAERAAKAEVEYRQRRTPAQAFRDGLEERLAGMSVDPHVVEALTQRFSQLRKAHGIDPDDGTVRAAAYEATLGRNPYAEKIPARLTLWRDITNWMLDNLGAPPEFYLLTPEVVVRDRSAGAA